ncbi:MAG: nucleoside-diphosphate kinase [Myxococcota bacterium]|jgi:nucleoside-diphosphate kinase
MLERTLSIIKPDAVERDLIGAILARIEAAGLRPIAMKMLRLTKEGAEGFYEVHRGKPFFDGLVEYMTSGPVVAMILEGEDAIQKYRGVMGATDPAKADPGTIRKDFAQSMRRNSVHGSDAPETAAYETAYFFGAMERCPRV